MKINKKKSVIKNHEKQIWKLSRSGVDAGIKNTDKTTTTLPI